MGIIGAAGSQLLEERMHCVVQENIIRLKIDSERAELVAARMRVEKLEDELAREIERGHAVRTVIGAVIASLWPFQLNRRIFTSILRLVGQSTPDEGRWAVRHAVLHEEATKVLRKDA